MIWNMVEDDEDPVFVFISRYKQMLAMQNLAIYV